MAMDQLRSRNEKLQANFHHLFTIILMCFDMHAVFVHNQASGPLKTTQTDNDKR